MSPDSPEEPNPALGSMPLAALAAGSERCFRGLYRPSFHRDVCITATVRHDGGEVEVAVADRPIVRVPLAPDRAKALVEALEALDRDALAAPPGLGCDGIRLAGAIAGAGEAFEFIAWSPQADDEPAQHAFFAALHRLATDTHDHPDVRLALEDLHTYLDLGLPIVDLGGVPRRVRIFGSLSYPAPDELTALCQSLVSHEPLVMDMGNFEGMGTLLYPLFRRIVRRPGPVTWCASRAARHHLVELKVKADAIFDRIEDALEECARRAGSP